MNFTITLILLVIIIRITAFSILNEASQIKKTMYFFLFVIHFLCFFLFLEIIPDLKKDSFNFYERALKADNFIDYLRPGSYFMTLIIMPFVKIGVSFFNLSLLCSTASYYAFNYIYKVTFLHTKVNSLALGSLFFLLFPTIHFWTAGITKEALVFPLMVLVFSDLKTSFKPSIFSIIASILVLFIRPYLFSIITSSFLITWSIAQKRSLKKNTLIVIIFLCLLLIPIPIFKSFLNIEIINSESINNVFNSIIDYIGSSGNSSIPITQTNYFERFFMVLFRPLFYDSHNIFQHLVSLENLLFIFLCIFSFVKLFKRGVKFIKISFFLFLTAFLIVLFLSFYMYNLGLASRMRVMFVPYFIIAIHFSFKVIESSNNSCKRN